MKDYEVFNKDFIIELIKSNQIMRFEANPDTREIYLTIVIERPEDKSIFG